MSEKVLTNGLHFAVYERLDGLSNLLAVFRTAADAESYAKNLQQKKTGNMEYYTKKI